MKFPKVYPLKDIAQIINSNFVENVIEIINETGANPQNLSLEVTESVFTDSFDLVNQKLGELQEIGITIFIDDFGTGYSSLSREREWNIDCLTLDHSLINLLESVSFSC